MTMEHTKGMVLRIERSSIHDGDGMRTVVFLKGCPLRCQWCSTPEGQGFQVEKTVDGTKTYGSEMSVSEVMQEVRKDSPFYFISGGGMTISGGEVLSQPDFSVALLKSAKAEGISTAIETSFFGKRETVAAMVPYVDTFYVDLKFVTPELHKKYCGVDNKIILDNIKFLDSQKGAFRVIIRTPLIPGINSGDEELKKIGTFCKNLKRMVHLQLLPYHSLGSVTYKKLGRKYLLEGMESPSPELMNHCREILRSYNIKVI
jgi:pyruvate formate lyase activating enzyme